MNLLIENKNIGTIGYAIHATLSDEVRDVLVAEGMQRILQGPVASEYENKAIALCFPLAKDKDGKFNRKGLEAAIERGDYPAFVDDEGNPRKFTRSDLPYSDELAAIWRECAMKATVEIAEGVEESLGITEVPTEVYEGASAKVPAFKEERDLVKLYLAGNGGKLASGEPRTLETYCASPNHGNGELPEPQADWEKDVTFLGALRALRKRRAASKD